MPRSRAPRTHASCARPADKQRVTEREWSSAASRDHGSHPQNRSVPLSCWCSVENDLPGVGNGDSGMCDFVDLGQFYFSFRSNHAYQAHWLQHVATFFIRAVPSLSPRTELCIFRVAFGKVQEAETKCPGLFQSTLDQIRKGNTYRLLRLDIPSHRCVCVCVGGSQQL